MDMVSINNAISMCDWSEEVIDWIWKKDSPDEKKSVLVIKKNKR